MANKSGARVAACASHAIDHDTRKHTHEVGRTFRINRSWFIPVATGGRCFIAEADASPGSLGQALCSAEMDDDLDIYEAGQGLTMLCTVALAKVDPVQVDP